MVKYLSKKLPRRAKGKNSGATRELPRLGGHFDFFAFLNKEGNANFEARLQGGGLGHVAARRVAARAGLGMSDRQFHVGRHLQTDGVAMVFMELNDESFGDE